MANTGNRASPQWRGLYEAAVLELDHGKLLERIAEARKAILDRMEDLSRRGTEVEELVVHKQAFPDSSRVEQLH